MKSENMEPNTETPDKMPPFRHIPLHTWWIHANQALPVVISGVWGIALPYDQRQISYLRIGSSNPVRMLESRWWELIEKGLIRPYVREEKLVEPKNENPQKQINLF